MQEGEPLENALRRFKRKVQQEDIIKEVKRHSFYLKPGEKRRVKEALARKRNRKKARKSRINQYQQWQEYDHEVAPADTPAVPGNPRIRRWRALRYGGAFEPSLSPASAL